MSPPANSAADAVRYSRQERLFTVGGPSQSKESRVDAVAIASEPNWMHKRTAQWTTYRITGYSHGDRPQMAIAGVHHTCHINAGQMYEEHHYTTISDSHVACPHRGRKRPSREAILRTVLALEWPELGQIGCYKVRWLPSAANKQNLTFFTKKRQSTQHCLWDCR